MNEKLLKELSDATGIPLDHFSEALNYPDSVVGFIPNIARARELCRIVEEGSVAGALILERWVDLCQTVKQTAEVYEIAGEGSAARSKAKDKWNKLSLARLNMATTSAQAKQVYLTSLVGSPVRRLAAEKCARLCRTLRQADRLWFFAPGGVLATLAQERMLELCTTIAQAKRIYDENPHGCEISRLALLKMIKIYRDRR